ncbi:hypothetical protein GGR50DRAFT_705919 [Xylaria sp. CBS 124048]|nr:hypothetical protein GGR50DRAFT_705919 [Xylaria sp. CBS 124048]
MPHIGVVMERSLQDRSSWGDAFVKLLSRSAVAALGQRHSIRDISGDISDATTAFSSWDNCFQAAFCKWPVIALFIIAGLIIFSILWCIIRCCCCGLSCCCQCCQCLKCCGECCGMCDPPRGKRKAYLDEPYVPAHHDQAYRSHAPMQYGLDPMKPTVPQYAEFDSGTNHADALPAMPSWEGANSKKVPVEGDTVELETLQKPNASHNQMSMNTSSYGPPGGAENLKGYIQPGQSNANAYGANQAGYNGNGYNSRGYGQGDLPDNMNNMVGVSTAGPLGRGTPQGSYNTGYDQGALGQGYSQYPASRSPRPYNDEYGRSITPASYDNRRNQGAASPGYGNDRMSPGPQPGYGYGNQPRMGSPGAQAGYGYGNMRKSPVPPAAYDHVNARASPAPQAGYGLPQRPYAQDESTPQYPAASHRREYSSGSQKNFAHPTPVRHFEPLQSFEPPQSPIRNNSGFDFNSGYSRPSSQASPAPTPRGSGGAAYPGHRTYKPAQDTQANYT